MISLQSIYILGFTLVSEKDWSGIYGGIFHYSMIFALTGSAAIAFIYFWRKKTLSFDEEPKFQMMEEKIHIITNEDSHEK